MKIKKIFSIILVISMLFSMPVLAEEAADGKVVTFNNETVDEFVSEEEAEAMLGEVAISMQTPQEIGTNEVEELFMVQEGVPQTYATTPDSYEPNDSPNTAYPYNSVSTITSSLSAPNDLYTLGMKSSNLHSPTDEDWYTVSLQAGTDYFVDLRNIGMRNCFIELYYLRADGTAYFYTTNPVLKPIYQNRAERYFYFTAEDTGTFYIRINNGNDWVDSMNYFFYVGPTIQYFNITNLPTFGNTQIMGTAYKTYTCDLRSIAPADTVLTSLSLTNNFVEGTPCYELDKRVSAGGKSYYNSAGTGSENINNVSGAELGQLWTIGGKCARGVDVCRWSAYMNGRFACIMAPYPGNEL